MRGSREGNQAGRTGRGLRVKINLPIFKDEKTKDAVTYHLWWWDIAIFHCLDWDDQHLLPYVFQSLEGFPGDLSMSLGKDATLTDVLQTMDKHFGIEMMSNTLRKELLSLKQGSGKNVAEFRMCLSQQVQILQSEYPGRIQQEHVKDMKQDHFYEGLSPKYRYRLNHKVDDKHLLVTPLASCSSEIGKIGRS